MQAAGHRIGDDRVYQQSRVYGREACVFVPESQLTMCVTICDPGAIDTGCPPKAPCHLIPGYRAGYCVP